jgi:hypothetical protein
MRLAGMPVDAPQVSVMPHTSSIGTPSARYHLTSSGEIGAAPVTRKRARSIPMVLRTFDNAIQLASVYLNFSRPSTGSPASTLSAIWVPTPIDQARAAPP